MKIKAKSIFYSQMLFIYFFKIEWSESIFPSLKEGDSESIWSSPVMSGLDNLDKVLGLNFTVVNV